VIFWEIHWVEFQVLGFAGTVLVFVTKGNFPFVKERSAQQMKYATELPMKTAIMRLMMVVNVEI